MGRARSRRPDADRQARRRPGFDILSGDAVERCQARDVSVVDSTGAGDALAAAFSSGGAELAPEAAARCVAQVGAMP
jgi:sugar/nucleoside kinase (ribokinase family)